MYEVKGFEYSTDINGFKFIDEPSTREDFSDKLSLFRHECLENLATIIDTVDRDGRPVKIILFFGKSCAPSIYTYVGEAIDNVHD